MAFRDGEITDSYKNFIEQLFHMEVTRMKYAIYFTWNDGFKDSFNVSSASERDMNIKNMIARKEFKSISYCRIYANGEYGKIKIIL